MYTVKIILNKQFRNGKISPYLYGSFVEHMGRVVYTGIYEPGHPDADEDGFRKDILQKTKEMGVTCVRYPGGNFVSCYDWKDGVGDKRTRPKKRELAWKSIETNEVGTDEFMRWIKKSSAVPIFTVNLGTKGIENAVTLLEYCNLPTGTFYSDYRAENGTMEPYGIPIWCLGNEMDGRWQIGYKKPEDYAVLAAQTAHAMKSLDPNIQLAVCGSSSTSTSTYTDWERIVLEETYEFADYISLHQYYGGQENGTEAFLGQSVEMEEYIDAVTGICDMVRSKKKLRKKINISFDEWGVWEIPGETVAESVSQRDWEYAPAFSEQVYTMEDALLFSSMLMAMIKKSDRVKIACQALLTNISACIMTEKGGESWRQTIFYPFSYMSKYGRGEVLETADEIPEYTVSKGYPVPYLDYVATYCNELQEVTLFAVNRRPDRAELEIELQGFGNCKILEAVTMYAHDLKDTNLKDHSWVIPSRVSCGEIKNGKYRGIFQPYSWNMIRIRTGEEEE